jgi:hypothetical protein
VLTFWNRTAIASRYAIREQSTDITQISPLRTSSDSSAVQDLPSLSSAAQPADQLHPSPQLTRRRRDRLERKERDKGMNQCRKRNTRGLHEISLADRQPIRTYRGFPELEALAAAAAKEKKTAVDVSILPPPLKNDPSTPPAGSADADAPSRRTIFRVQVCVSSSSNMLTTGA